MICADQQKRILCALPHTGRNACVTALPRARLCSCQCGLILFSSLSLSLSFFFLMFEKYNRTVFSAWGYLHVLKLHFKLSLFLI